MILRCSYEELTALTNGIESVLASYDGGGVAAPPEVVADVEALLPRLSGDLSVRTYARQQTLERVIALVTAYLQERMESAITEEHVGSESAVLAYFDFGHVLAMRERVARMGAEMRAMIELMTGSSPDDATTRTISFPD